MSAPVHNMVSVPEAQDSFRIAIQLEELNDVSYTNETVTLGVAFEESQVFESTQLLLSDEAASNPLVFHLSPHAYWPDSSIKWAHLHFAADLASGGNRTLALTRLDTVESGSSGNRDVKRTSPKLCEASRNNVSDDGETLEVITSAYRARLKRGADSVQLLTPDAHPVMEMALQCQLAKSSDPASCYTSQALPIKQAQLVDQNDVFSRMLVEYDCFAFDSEGSSRASDAALQVKQTLTIHHASGAVQQSLTLHNPGAAYHPGGFWDLGSEGSVWIKSFDVVCSVHERQECQLELAADAESSTHTIAPDKTINLYQESSGGENWQSRVHVNHAGEVPMQFRGYRLTVNESEQTSGHRADPLLFFPDTSSETTNTGSGIGFYYRNFWQSFPSQVSVKGSETGSVITLSLLPADFPDLHEIQGGEKLSKELWCASAQSLEQLHSLREPLVAVVPSEHWVDTKQLHFFDTKGGSHPGQKLIAPSLEGAQSFLAKRETYDEYGWRNFGELFADHESWKLEEGYRVSHYNNQYDAIYSFGLQFLRTGDRRWFTLMDDLARHVVTIDLYHTDKDREEFNGAAFWHTDHYMDAHTSTHRAHSIGQRESAGKMSGGCFSPQHCYSAGFALHYFLTGEQASRDAVISMTNWILQLENYPDSLIGTVQNVAENELRRLRELRGQGSALRYSHKLNRGTGNFLSSLINAYEVSGEKHWLQHAEDTIRDTLHYRDEIAERDLMDSEYKWSYAVFLFGMTRYLSVKELEGELDESYWYAREAFVAYMRWVLENELPYLQNPQKVEIVNSTWPAQDSRKCYLLHQAAYYDPSNEADYLASSDNYMAHILEELGESDELSYTRVQVLLLQSFCYDKSVKSDKVRFATHDYDLGEPPQAKIAGELLSMAKKLGRSLLRISPAREYRTLRSALKLNR